MAPRVGVQRAMDITIIPTHQKGFRTGASTHEEKATRHDAILLFEIAKSRLLNVNNWHRLCGPPTGEFRLTDDKGNEVSRNEARVGDLIRIKLPAPKNAEGGGYDWVRVEEFENRKDLLKDQDIFGFRVRPVKSPFAGEKNAEAHFYTSSATSTFLVMRVSSKVTAMEKGRNEVANNKPGALFSKVRNLFLSVGAWLGLSHSQWSKLVRGVIKGPVETP
jgi:hypothetical protein